MKEMNKATKKIFGQALKSSPYAQYQLHIYFSNKYQTAKNAKREFFWLKKSAAHGYVPSMFWLAEELAEHPNELHKRDIKKAIKLMRKAADADFFVVKYRLKYYLWLEEQMIKSKCSESDFVPPLDELDFYEKILVIPVYRGDAINDL